MPSPVIRRRAAGQRSQGRVELKLEVPKRLKALMDRYASRRSTSIQQLVVDHMVYLTATDKGLIVNQGGSLDPELLKWAVAYAKRSGTTVPQILVSYLQYLKSEDDAGDISSV